MKPVIIIAIVFVLLIPTGVFAQEESLSELTARLDAENLQKSQQIGSSITTSPIPQEDILDCPKGTYHGLDNQNNPVCRTIQGNQIIDANTGLVIDFNSGLSRDSSGRIILQDEDMMYVVLIILIFFLVIAIAIKSSKKKPKRRGFSQDTKDKVDRRQRGECNACHEIPRHKKYDHINQNWDNSLRNCQMLCGDCHDDKTNRERAWRDKRR